MFKKAVFTVLFSCLLFVNTVGFVKAESDQSYALSNQKINPGSMTYSLKRLWEKGVCLLPISESYTLKCYRKLLVNRVSELKYVVDNNLLDELQKATERVSYQAGILADHLVNKNDTQSRSSILKNFETYTGLLAGLRDSYETDSSFWMLVQHSINSIRLNSEKIQV